MNNNQIELFLSSNDKYAQHLGVAIASILQNSGEEKLNFHIQHSGISEKNIENILSLKKIRDFDIEFNKVEYVEGSAEYRQITRDACSRILIPEMFPHLKKGLYLDCDIVARSSLLPLWNTDISDFYLGACLDFANYVAHSNSFFAQRIEIITGSLENLYFNSGVLLLNLEKLREFNLKEKFIEYIKVNEDKLRYYDQDTLNGLFINKVKFLEQGWNYDGRFQNALKTEPRIIHFTTNRKPWDFKDVPFYEEYEKYLKLTPWAVADINNLVTGLKSQGKKIVTTNGCFDIIHAGHVRYLNQAKRLGDVLIVCLNSDESVRRLKGPSRPINSQEDRAEVLSALASVDFVVIFEEDTPSEILGKIKPHIHVKGGDYTEDSLPEAEIIRKEGGKIQFIPLVQGRSTTNTINRAKNHEKYG